MGENFPNSGISGWKMRMGGQFKGLICQKTFFLTILILISGCFFCVQYANFSPRFHNSDIAPSSSNVKNGRFLFLGLDFASKKETEKNSCHAQEKSWEDNYLALDFSGQYFEKELEKIVGNHPIREMIPYISEKDRDVAALLIGIAKKESNWGKRAPSLYGRDCYNYWGYKGKGSRGTALGYGCFATPEEGVRIVGERIENLVSKNLNTPSEIVVWKCGFTCRDHNASDVAKWISDVGIYFHKVADIAYYKS